MPKSRWRRLSTGFPYDHVYVRRDDKTIRLRRESLKFLDGAEWVLRVDGRVVDRKFQSTDEGPPFDWAEGRLVRDVIENL